MKPDLLDEIEAFISATGLSPYRVGIICVGNGRLVERLRAGRRVWPETESRIVAALARERKRINQTPEDAA